MQSYDSIMQQIKKGEEKIIRRQEIQHAIEVKIQRYRQPFQQLRINYGNNKGKNFTEEEDRYLVCMLHLLQYDSENCYERLRREVRNAPAFRFDWFIKSRTSTELQRTSAFPEPYVECYTQFELRCLLFVCCCIPAVFCLLTCTYFKGRCNTLISLIEKENEELAERDRAEKRKKKTGSSTPNKKPKTASAKDGASKKASGKVKANK